MTVVKFSIFGTTTAIFRSTFRPIFGNTKFKFIYPRREIRLSDVIGISLQLCEVNTADFATLKDQSSIIRQKNPFALQQVINIDSRKRSALMLSTTTGSSEECTYTNPKQQCLDTEASFNYYDNVKLSLQKYIYFFSDIWGCVYF